MHLKGENIKMAHWVHFKVADECNFTELSGVSLLSSLPGRPYDVEFTIW